MPSQTIDFIFKGSSKGFGDVADSLKRIESQANVTREKMEKLTQVGSRLAVLGAAVTAPFALAMKKYIDTAKDTEPVSRRILALNQKWEESQVRLGRIVATQVLPALEAGADVLNKVIAFAEANPGVVKAALTIGTTLVVLGGLITTTAQLVATVATIQGLAASAGLASVGGGVGAAGGAAAIGASVTAGLSAFFANVFVPIMALAVGAQIGLWFGNWLTGTNQTWGDIWETVKMLPSVITFGMKLVAQDIAGVITSLGKGIYSLGSAIVNGIASFGAALGSSIVNGLRSLIGARASGGYVTSGLYAMGERGREFVMNASTTRNAERAIGGPLSQNGAMSYVTNNVNLPSGMTINQVKQIVRSANAELLGSLLG